MDFEEIVTVSEAILKEVVVKNSDITVESFTVNNEQEISDPYFLEAFLFMKALSSDQRETFRKILVQNGIECLSMLFGIVENSDDADLGQRLSVYFGEEDISANLQSAFLVADERVRGNFNM